MVRKMGPARSTDPGWPAPAIPVRGREQNRWFARCAPTATPKSPIGLSTMAFSAPSALFRCAGHTAAAHTRRPPARRARRVGYDSCPESGVARPAHDRPPAGVSAFERYHVERCAQMRHHTDTRSNSTSRSRQNLRTCCRTASSSKDVIGDRRQSRTPAAVQRGDIDAGSDRGSGSATSATSRPSAWREHRIQSFAPPATCRPELRALGASVEISCAATASARRGPQRAHRWARRCGRRWRPPPERDGVRTRCDRLCRT